MTSSSFRSRAAAWLLALAAGTLSACSSAEEPGGLPPNLLFLSIDTLRADALGSYGGTWDASPFLDRFADAGLTFTSSWSHTPKTAPSHMSMFTGLPPRVHGVGNQKSSGNETLSRDITTLAEALSDAGYRTGAVTSGGNVKGYLGFERGFEIYDETPKNLPKKLADAASWITAVGAEPRPWFFFFHTYAVHDPYLPPAKFQKRFVDADYQGEILGDAVLLQQAVKDDDRAPWASSHQKAAENFWARVDQNDPADLAHLHQLYMASVASLDFQLKRFFEELEAAGQLENTLIVLTSDHGEEFGEHGKTRHDQLWQELLHVPLLVHLPGDSLQSAAPGRRILGVVRHMDLVPSLIELLGQGPAAPFQQDFLGVSWAPWVADSTLEERDRTVFSEHRSKLERPLDLWALRQGEGLLIQPEPEAPVRFLDRALDPLEVVSQAPDGQPGAPADAEPRAAHLFDLRAAELGRFQKAAGIFGRGAGIELDAETRAELEALGYL